MECGYEPPKLTHWWACDIPPRLDTTAGAALVVDFVRAHDIQVVVIDGINGTVGGAEKDDQPWRLLFDYAIRPLKELGVAVVTADNLGKDSTLGPRGSSVKLDKADAVLNLTRTANGVNLHASHRRTAAYPLDTALVVYGLEGDEPIHYRRALGAVYPDGTVEVRTARRASASTSTLTAYRCARSCAGSPRPGDPRRYRCATPRSGRRSSGVRAYRRASGTTLGSIPGSNRGQAGDSDRTMPSDQGVPPTGTTGTAFGASLGTAGGVVDTPVPNAGPARQVDPNDELF